MATGVTIPVELTTATDVLLLINVLLPVMDAKAMGTPYWSFASTYAVMLKTPPDKALVTLGSVAAKCVSVGAAPEAVTFRLVISCPVFHSLIVVVMV